MNLTFSTEHLAFITNFCQEKNLFFKVKSGFKAANGSGSVTVTGITPQEVISIYPQISETPESVAGIINNEIKQALLPQLVDNNGQPKGTEEAGLISWIQQYTSYAYDRKLAMINNGLAELNR